MASESISRFAAGGRRRPGHRGDARQRDGLRLPRRHQGHHHRGDPRAGSEHASQLKECTRASTSSGSCTSLCQGLRAVAPEFEDERKTVVCACVPFAEDKLRDILRSQKLRSVQEVLEIYGNGVGCEICVGAHGMLDMLGAAHHEEDRSARFIIDRP